MILKLYLTGVFLIIGLFHLYWAFGGNWGLKAAIPENEKGPLFKAEFGGTLVIAIIFILGVNLVIFDIMKYRIIFLQNYLYHFMAIVFFLRGVGDFKYVGIFKRVKNTKFARYDYLLYSPLCFSVSIIAALQLI